MKLAEVHPLGNTDTDFEHFVLIKMGISVALDLLII